MEKNLPIDYKLKSWNSRDNFIKLTLLASDGQVYVNKLLITKLYDKTSVAGERYTLVYTMNEGSISVTETVDQILKLV